MVAKYLPLFQLLVETLSEQRSAILKTLSTQQLRAVLEAIYNVLKGTCPLNDKDKKLLYNYRTSIRRLVSKRLTRKQQRRLLKKYGDILPALLKPVVEFLRNDD